MRNRHSETDLFKGRHLEQEIIVLCVRWYLRYKLSFRDLLEMTPERACRSLTRNSSLGATLHTSVRQALEPFFGASGHLLASERTLGYLVIPRFLEHAKSSG
jgi:hypothetical protein